MTVTTLPPTAATTAHNGLAQSPAHDSLISMPQSDLCQVCALEPGDDTGVAQTITGLKHQHGMTQIQLSCGHQILTWY